MLEVHGQRNGSEDIHQAMLHSAQAPSRKEGKPNQTISNPSEQHLHQSSDVAAEQNYGDDQQRNHTSSNCVST